jgi:LmbE family N-acetylglucosaminyl deacetylase
LLFSLWLVGFIVLNDFSVPTISKSEHKNVLVIFPHPDDESLTIGGLSKMISGQNGQINLLVLTAGEKGEGGPNLKEIRTQEMQQSAKIIGISNLIQQDFGDGQINSKISEVTDFIDSQINSLQPDLIITYDLAGLYGHQDHMATSSIVTKLVQEKYPTIALWYTSLPAKVIKLANLPTHMAQDPDFASKRSLPNSKIFIGSGFITKIQSVKAHHSQYQSFRQSVPNFLPLEFVYSLQLFEYYHQVN